MSNEDKKTIHFREKALEQINRPVLIDDVLQVIAPRNWLLLLLIFFIMLVFVVWLIIGQLFIYVEGNGILLNANGEIVTVLSPAEEGTINHIYTKVGDKVNKNDLLFTMDSALSLQLESAKKYLVKLQEEQKDLSIRAKEIIANLEKNQHEQIIKMDESRIAALEKLKQLDVMKKLKEIALKKGVIDLPNVTETRIEYFRLLQEIRSHEANLISMKASMIDLRDKWRERERDIALSVLRQASDVELLMIRFNASHAIKSPVTGIVSEIRVVKGDRTKPGEILLSIIPEQQDLYALLFVSANKGKLIKTGMPAQINPTIFNKLEYGSMKGHVQNISFYPVSQEYMMSVLKNTKLVDSFLSNESLMAVKIKLDSHPDTPSGYQWTGYRGPNVKLTQGTLVSGKINVQTKNPIDLLIHFYE